MSAQTQNLDRNVIRSAALASQFDQLAAGLFRAFVFHGGENLGVAHLAPESVATEQQDVLGVQRLGRPGASTMRSGLVPKAAVRMLRCG